MPVTEYMTCNYGSIPANTVMTSSLKTKPEVDVYKNFLLKAAQWFGPSGQYRNQFDMFSSQPWGYFNRRNLLFMDSTQTLVDVGEKNTYYSWVGELKIFFQLLSSTGICLLCSSLLKLFPKTINCLLVWKCSVCHHLKPSAIVWNLHSSLFTLVCLSIKCCKLVLMCNICHQFFNE